MEEISVLPASGLYFNSHSDCILAPGKERHLSVSMVTSYLNSDEIIKVSVKGIRHNISVSVVEKNPLHVFCTPWVVIWRDFSVYQKSTVFTTVYNWSSSQKQVWGVNSSREISAFYFSSSKVCSERWKAEMTERLRGLQGAVNGMELCVLPLSLVSRLRKTDLCSAGSVPLSTWRERRPAQVLI